MASLYPQRWKPTRKMLFWLLMRVQDWRGTSMGANAYTPLCTRFPSVAISVLVPSWDRPEAFINIGANTKILSHNTNVPVLL